MAAPGALDFDSPESVRDPTAYFAAARERAGDVQWSESLRALSLIHI